MIAPEIITGIEPDKRLLFTPLPLEGFNEEHGLFVPVRRYGDSTRCLWQYAGMREPEGQGCRVFHVGAGILRPLGGMSDLPWVKFLALVGFDSPPYCDPAGEDLVLEGGIAGNVTVAGKAPLLRDMPSLRPSISKRFGSFPMQIAKLIPAPSQEFLMSYKTEEYGEGISI